MIANASCMHLQELDTAVLAAEELAAAAPQKVGAATRGARRSQTATAVPDRTLLRSDQDMCMNKQAQVCQHALTCLQYAGSCLLVSGKQLRRASIANVQSSCCANERITQPNHCRRMFLYPSVKLPCCSQPLQRMHSHFVLASALALKLCACITIAAHSCRVCSAHSS